MLWLLGALGALAVGSAVTDVKADEDNNDNAETDVETGGADVGDDTQQTGLMDLLDAGPDTSTGSLPETMPEAATDPHNQDLSARDFASQLLSGQELWDPDLDLQDAQIASDWGDWHDDEAWDDWDDWDDVDDEGTYDLVTGTEAADTLIADQGAAFLTGRGGDDLMLGGAGDDDFSGGAGDDTGLGGAGADTLRGEAGDDRLAGQMGDDDIFGAEGDDTLLGGAGADSLAGGDGDDLLIGGEGADTLHGVQGDDVLSGGAGEDVLFGGLGNDVISGLEAQGEAARDFLNGGAGDDQLIAGEGDVVSTGSGADSVTLDFFEGGEEPIFITDFTAAEDRLVISYEDTDGFPPDLSIETDEEDEAFFRVLLDDVLVAEVLSDAPLAASHITLQPFPAS